MTFPNNSVIALSGWKKQNLYLSICLHLCQNQAWGIHLTLLQCQAQQLFSNLADKQGILYYLTTGLVNSDKAIHKMTPNCWHLSINRILNGFPWLEDTKGFKGAFFALLRSSLPTAKKVPFSRFWEHPLPTAKTVPFYAFHEIAWNRKKRYFFCHLKHRLVKWEMDEERIILTSKYHSLENWK